MEQNQNDQNQEQLQEQVQEVIPITMDDMVEKYKMQVIRVEPLYKFIIDNGGDGNNNFYCNYQNNILEIYFRSPMGNCVFYEPCDVDKIDVAVSYCGEYLAKLKQLQLKL
jgi:hypothetical protein